MSNQREKFDSYYAGLLGGRVFRWLDFKKVRIARSVLREMGENPRVIDLGCGSGAVASRLVRSMPGLELLAVDQDSRLLELAAARGLETRQVDFDKPLPFAAGSFDAVLMVDTIEHVRSRGAAMREVTRILNNDGAVIIFTPPYDTFAWWLGERLHRFITRRRADHISPFTRESLEWLLTSHFSRMRTTYVNCRLTLAGVGWQKRLKYAQLGEENVNCGCR